jgi:hypothetical protein
MLKLTRRGFLQASAGASVVLFVVNEGFAEVIQPENQAILVGKVVLAGTTTMTDREAAAMGREQFLAAVDRHLEQLRGEFARQYDRHWSRRRRG